MEYDHLNPQQRQAVEHTQGPLMILAGAGSGKTRVITERIVHLIKKGVAPENILAVTFTNKAAKEMRERVLSCMDSAADLNRPVQARTYGLGVPHVATFHSLGVTLLREHYREVGVPRHFSIYDRSDSIRAIKHSLAQLGLDPKQFEPRVVLSAISRYKSEGHSVRDFTPEITDVRRHTLSRIWEGYEQILKKEGALDFDDLLVRTYALMQHNEAVRRKLHARWTHIHIDEYQDTNRVQFEITKLLTSTDANLCVVGDIDQNIYSWRGANLANLLSFEDEFPGTQLIILEQNYRSTKHILDAANNVIAKNKKRKDKKLFTTNEPGECIRVHGAYTEDAEARFVVQCITENIKNGVQPRDIAVLYRANFQSRALEQACMHADIPYQVLGTRFFDRSEVKDILSYLRASLNPDAHGALARIVSTPPRGIGKMTLAKMISGTEHELSPALQKRVADFRALLHTIETAAKTTTPSETIKHIVHASGLETKLRNGTEEDLERLENIYELATLATKYDELPFEEGIERLLEDASLATDQDTLERDANTIKLMTVHAAKGLEFDSVYIVGMEEGLFPYERVNDTNVDEEEERRLFYVALTRARKEIHLSYAYLRTLYGTQTSQTISSFIEDIGASNLVYDETLDTTGEHKIDLIDF